MNRELIFLRAFAVATVAGLVFISTTAFKKFGNQKFGEIDVERINIVEKDGTVKMIITNVDRFPNGTTQINNRPTNADRKNAQACCFLMKKELNAAALFMMERKQPMVTVLAFP